MTTVQAVEPKINEVEITPSGFLLRFKEVSDQAVTSIAFNKTLRLPQTEQVFPLPPGLGNFPIKRVDQYEKVPDRFKKYGGYMFPMANSEAMFVGFSHGYPVAIQVAAGCVNCVTGEKFNRELTKDPQNYLAPGQPWLDGFSTGKDTISQFISMPLESGTTVEEQVTGEAEFGGLQFICYPMKKDVYDRRNPPRPAYRGIVPSGGGLVAGGGEALSPFNIAQSFNAAVVEATGIFAKYPSGKPDREAPAAHSSVLLRPSTSTR